MKPNRFFRAESLRRPNFFPPAAVTASRALLLLSSLCVAASPAASPGEGFCFTVAPSSELISCEYAQDEGATLRAVPEIAANKRTRSGKYLFASDAHAFVSSRDVLFIDVRTRGEFSFVGVAEGVQAHVPFVDMTEASQWEPKSGRYAVSGNLRFVQEIAKYVHSRDLGRDAKIVLICRSGDRSASAADALADAGYRNVYSVVDGFEGDLSAAGRRDVNGWKNAGLPWSYRAQIGQFAVRK
ncbi:MAG: hypothetical protein EAZ30_16540 [Betaproteobacteria bacterium]|nr:MAG: hypothetical protein EAZ30_16540 [Betaproteobacteria bacterium]